MERYKLDAAPRTQLGKQKVRKLKADGFIPAVIYGRGIEPTPLQVRADAFLQMLKSAGSNVLIDLAIEGQAPVTAMVKKVARNPLSLQVQNIDFHKVATTDRVHARVAIEFVGDAPGVTLGGQLLLPVSDLEIIGEAQSLPTSIKADVSGLGLDQSLHVRDLAVPEGVEIVAPADEVVAVVHAPRGAEAEAGEAEAAAEPEAAA